MPPAWLPSRPDRFEPNGWRKSLAIWILLTMTSLTAGCAAIDAPVAGCEWIRPIILDEDDSLTTGTKRVVLAPWDGSNSERQKTAEKLRTRSGIMDLNGPERTRNGGYWTRNGPIWTRNRDPKSPPIPPQRKASRGEARPFAKNLTLA